MFWDEERENDIREREPLPPPSDFEPPQPPPKPPLLPPPPPPPPRGDEILPPVLAKGIILKMLKAKPMHGYDLAEEISTLVGRKIFKSRIYNILNTFEKQGLIYGKWEVQEKKARKVYYITEHGEAALEELKKPLSVLKNALDYFFT